MQTWMNTIGSISTGNGAIMESILILMMIENRYDGWDSDVEYIMTEHGLERTDRNFAATVNSLKNPNDGKPEKKEAPERKEGTDSQNKKNDNPNGDYRYHKPKTATSAAVPGSGYRWTTM